MRVTRVAVVAMMAGVGSLAACGGETGSSGSAGAYLTYPVSGDDEGFDAALLEGELGMEDGCLTISDGQGPAALAFAEGSATWSKDAQVLEVDGASFRLGDRVLAAGGAGDDLENSACPSLSIWRVAPDGLTPAR